jgi:hypothetical protein
MNPNRYAEMDTESLFLTTKTEPLTDEEQEYLKDISVIQTFRHNHNYRIVDAGLCECSPSIAY